MRDKEAGVSRRGFSILDREKIGVDTHLFWGCTGMAGRFGSVNHDVENFSDRSVLTWSDGLLTEWQRVCTHLRNPYLFQLLGQFPALLPTAYVVCRTRAPLKESSLPICSHLSIQRLSQRPQLFHFQLSQLLSLCFDRSLRHLSGWRGCGRMLKRWW